MAPIPQHVALIMDGNGRWARAQGQPRLFGHKQGAETLKAIVETASKLGISYLTVYAFSSENWGRSSLEVRGLMTLIELYLEREEAALLAQNIRLRVIGDLSRLPSPLQDRIIGVETRSSPNTGLCLQVALSYGGRSEIVSAVQRMAGEIVAGRLTCGDITEERFAGFLYTAGAPDPDLLIRTGGEERVSNFLLWQLAYTEFAFVPTYWPDFGPDEFRRIVDIYQTRERRFGGAE
jgi:undecaprenyl diphosphate synthase